MSQLFDRWSTRLVEDGAGMVLAILGHWVMAIILWFMVSHWIKVVFVIYIAVSPTMYLFAMRRLALRVAQHDPDIEVRA